MDKASDEGSQDDEDCEARALEAVRKALAGKVDCSSLSIGHDPDDSDIRYVVVRGVRDKDRRRAIDASWEALSGLGNPCCTRFIPEIKVCRKPEYCTNEAVDSCGMCPFSSYGMDCMGRHEH